MPQIASGKSKIKSSKTKSSKSSTSKRHFTVVIGSKEHGLYVSSSPSSAARKAVSKLCATDKKKKVEFCLREITQGSKKKTYGPYLGHIEKLKKKIELKGRVIENLPVARLKPNSSAKKGGMRGGGEELNVNDFHKYQGNYVTNRKYEVKQKDNKFLFFGETSYMPHGNMGSNTTCYKYVGIFMDEKIQEFRQLIISSDSECCWISENPISFEEIKKNDLDSLKKLREFIISQKNNSNFSFCEPIIELFSNIQNNHN
jgi:hypothetical protein